MGVILVQQKELDRARTQFQQALEIEQEGNAPVELAVTRLELARLEIAVGAPQRAIDLALQAVRALEIPHLEWEDDVEQVVH
jgi:hypothetical protein